MIKIRQPPRLKTKQKLAVYQNPKGDKYSTSPLHPNDTETSIPSNAYSCPSSGEIHEIDRLSSFVDTFSISNRIGRLLRATVLFSSHSNVTSDHLMLHTISVCSSSLSDLIWRHAKELAMVAHQQKKKACERRTADMTDCKS